MGSRDQDYLLARAQQELSLAEQADDARVRRAHLAMAHEYQIRADVFQLRARTDNDVSGLTSSASEKSPARDRDS